MPKMNLTCFIERTPQTAADPTRFFQVMTNEVILQHLLGFLTYQDLIHLQQAFQPGLDIYTNVGMIIEKKSNKFEKIELFPADHLVAKNHCLWSLVYNRFFHDLSIKVLDSSGSREYHANSLNTYGTRHINREFNILNIVSYAASVGPQNSYSSTAFGKLQDNTVFFFSGGENSNDEQIGSVLYAPSWPHLINYLPYKGLLRLVENIKTSTGFSEYLKVSLNTAFRDHIRQSITGENWGIDQPPDQEVLSTLTARLTRALLASEKN